jgi:hypothetical protein
LLHKQVNFFSKNTYFCNENSINKPAMTEKEIRQRLAILNQQLDIINLYPEDFIKIEGVKGLEERINRILDEKNYLNKRLKEL